MADNDFESWDSRHDEEKRLKTSGKFGWMHLIIGQRKSDGKKVMRLKRYYNWFNIPSQEYLHIVQKMLEKGAKELGWTSDKSTDVEIKEDKVESKEGTSDIDEIPEEIIEFLKNYPKTSKRILELVNVDDLDDEDYKYLAELIQVLTLTLPFLGFNF